MKGFTQSETTVGISDTLFPRHGQQSLSQLEILQLAQFPGHLQTPVTLGQKRLWFATIIIHRPQVLQR